MWRLIASAALLLSPTLLRPADAPNLREIMTGLGRHMEAITAGITREDWPSVATEAARIAGHPQPPISEKMRIMGFAGTRVSQFRTYDAGTRRYAEGIRESANAKDGPGVILAFAKLQESCLGCHQAFRKAYIHHFREAR
jgi:cytochrome c556